MTTKMKVKKRNNTFELIDLNKIHVMVERSCKNLTGVSSSQVEIQSGIQFYDGITTEEIQQILIKSASDLISLTNPNYQYVAARLLLFSLYKQIFNSSNKNDFLNVYDHLCAGVSLNIYDENLLNKYSKSEWNDINDFIDHDRDFLFTYAGLQQVIDKYLVQDRSTKKVFETPQYMYILIAATLFQNYLDKTRLSYIKKYYDAISKHKINIPTPIMAGVRTSLKQFASCTLIDIDDSLDSIFSSDMAIGYYVSQRSGIGINAGRIRAINSKIRNGEVIHTGVIPFLKKFESTVRCCTQNGIRGGSATVHFPIWHREIEDIIVLKNNKGTEDNRVRKLDYSIQLSKLFYERFIHDEDISLFSPHDVPELTDNFGLDTFDELYISAEKNQSISRKTIKAQELILNLLKERAETGRIYIMNIDHCNSHSSFIDKIWMSNLCVSGDTKITIQFYLEKEYVKKTISIKNLDEYINNSNYKELKVLSYNIQSNEKEWSNITNFAKTSPKTKVMKIIDEESGKSIIVTPEHYIFTKNRGYVMSKDLTENDELVIN